MTSLTLRDVASPVSMLNVISYSRGCAESGSSAFSMSIVNCAHHTIGASLASRPQALNQHGAHRRVRFDTRCGATLHGMAARPGPGETQSLHLPGAARRRATSC